MGDRPSERTPKVRRRRIGRSLRNARSSGKKWLLFSVIFGGSVLLILALAFSMGGLTRRDARKLFEVFPSTGSEKSRDLSLIENYLSSRLAPGLRVVDSIRMNNYGRLGDNITYRMYLVRIEDGGGFADFGVRVAYGRVYDCQLLQFNQFDRARNGEFVGIPGW